MQQENEKQQKENVGLKQQREQWLTQYNALNGSAQGVEEVFLQSMANMDRIISKLTSFDQRIKFAGSRIHFISGRET